MASAALKTLLACSRPGATTRQDLGALAAEYDATVLDLGEADRPSILLFDRPRQAVQCALAWTLPESTPTTEQAQTGESPPSSRRRTAVHLGEVTHDGDLLQLDPAARQHLERLMRLALDGQTLVSTAVESLLRYSSSSGSESSAPTDEWAWRHHGRYRFSDEETAIEVIEVGGSSAHLQSPDSSKRLSSGQEDDVELRPGDSLLRYRILDVLGRGGMGVVYRAEDGRLQRQVALKMLPSRLAGDHHYLQRFEREVRAIAAVNHPNIVTIHNVEHDGNVRFLTMEVVEGELLGSAIPEDGMALARVLDLAIALSDALIAAHRRGIVHRDLKPGNVMLTRDGLVKVLDFGLAKLRDEKRDSVTDPGQMIGTLAYMAPEQIRGQTVDARVDLFALGVLIYELATGRRPFGGQGASLMYAVLQHQPERLASARSDLPAELGELITHCLQKNPQERIGSAGEIRHRLLEIQRQAGLSTSSLHALGPARQVGHRRTSGLLASRLLASRLLASRLLASRLLASKHFAWSLTLLVVGLGVIFLRPTSSHDGSATAAPDPMLPTTLAGASATKPRLVVLPCRNEAAGERRAPFFAAGLTTDITSRLASATSLEVISYSSALSYSDTDRSQAEIAQELAVTHIVTCELGWLDKQSALERPGHEIQAHQVARNADHVVSLEIEILRTLDDRRVDRHRFIEEHDDHFELQTLLAQKVVAKLAQTFSMPKSPERPISNIKAYSAYLRGLHQSSLPDYTPEHRRGIIRHFEAAVAADPDFVVAWAELAKAQALFFHLRHDMSRQQSRRALEAAVRARGLDPDSPQVRLAEGLVHYWTERDYAAALVDLAYAAERLPNEWEVYSSMAWIHRREGRGTLAWANLSRALMLNPRDPVLRTHIGITATWLRNYHEARDLLESAIAEAPDKPMAFWLLALTHWLSSGETTRAREVLEAMPENDPRVHWYWFRQLLYERRPNAARERLEAIEGEWIELSDFSAPVALARAQSWQQEGHAELALAAWQEAAVALRQHRDKRSRDPRFLAALAVAEAALGERQAALEAAHQAIAIRPLESDAYEGPSYLEHLAWTHLLLGDEDQVIKILGELLIMPSRLSPELLRLDPRWDSLRGKPAFDEISQRIR